MARFWPIHPAWSPRRINPHHPLTMQEPEQEKCGTTHYAGCACHEQGWENKWKAAIEMAAQASVERDEYRCIAGELVAAIRVNTMRGTFATATIEDVDQWLKQWTDKFGPKPTFCPTNASAQTRPPETPQDDT